MSDFEKFKDDAFSVWGGAFDAMVDAGVDANEAAEIARNLLQQVLMAWGSAKAVISSPAVSEPCQK